jgi:TetR/AcrR family transcriptional regulator, cholesterol catabolism regulator
VTKKGDKTKQIIIDTSEQLFAQKGYAALTMKDICEACNLSRGGLYRYFSSTKEIFMAMLEKDVHNNRFALELSLSQKVSAITIFFSYLNQEKNAVFSPYNGLYFAIHEFAFLESDQRIYLDNRLKNSLEILGILFKYGQETDEFKNFDIEVVANHLLYFFDSLKTSSSALSITVEMVEKQINLIKDLVI